MEIKEFVLGESISHQNLVNKGDAGKFMFTKVEITVNNNTNATPEELYSFAKKQIDLALDAAKVDILKQYDVAPQVEQKANVFNKPKSPFKR